MTICNNKDIEIIRYAGGSKHLSILYKVLKTNKLFIRCYETNKIYVSFGELEWTSKFSEKQRVPTEINIPINVYKDSAWYQIEIDNEEEFTLAEKIISLMMEGHYE